MKYVYGVVPTREVAGANLVLAGLQGAALQTMACNGVSAVVSEAPPYDYAGLPKQQLVKVLAQHQQATERIMQVAPTLLPFKFGTLLREEEVTKLLQQSVFELEHALSRVDQHVEVELLAMWDPQQVFAQIAQHPQIAALREQAQGKTPEEVQRLQLAVGALVKQLLDATREAYAVKIRSALSDLARDVEINAMVNDQVVANIAFLLPCSKRTEFDERVVALDAEFGGQLLFKVVGPLPPYSFSTVEVERVLPQDVAWASEQLGLEQTASGDDIRSAYLRQARLHHPDNNAQNGEAANLFKDDHAAYRLLRTCHAMQHRALAPETPESTYCCDLASAAAAGGLLLVNISRSSDLAARN
jgi:hypothetical protein